MERLTELTRLGEAIPRMDLKNNGHRSCVKHLAAYEDTGLTPEEIESLKRTLLNWKECKGWIPVSERLPEDGKYMLLSFSNFSLPAVGRYESDEKGGAFYLGDCDEGDTCAANDLFVNAWMLLPEPYRTEPGKE